jgi:hypothetical protein
MAERSEDMKKAQQARCSIERANVLCEAAQ